MGKELGCLCLRLSTTDEENHSTVGEKEFYRRTDASGVERLGEKPFSTTCDVAYVVWGIYRILLLNNALACTYYYFFINGFYRDDVIKLGSTQSEE